MRVRCWIQPLRRALITIPVDCYLMDVDLVRHALTVARDRGFAEVELSGKDGAFSASAGSRSVGEGSFGCRG